jgi:hypothetical protein
MQLQVRQVALRLARRPRELGVHAHARVPVLVLASWPEWGWGGLHIAWIGYCNGGGTITHGPMPDCRLQHARLKTLCILRT